MFVGMDKVTADGLPSKKCKCWIAVSVNRLMLPCLVMVRV